MIIKKLELADYRNYESLELQFDKGTNILYGDNAQGKTNILEAIYVAATTKSHKGSKDKEIVNFNKEEAHIRTYLEKEGVETRVDMHLRKSKSKGIAIDCQKIKNRGIDVTNNQVNIVTYDKIIFIGISNGMLIIKT